MMRRRSPYHHRTMRVTDHHAVGTKRQITPNTSPPHLTVKAEIKRFKVIHMTFGGTWKVEQDILDRSTDREDAPRHATTAIYSDVTSLVMSGPRTVDGLHQSYIAMRPDIEAPHTLFASLTKSWNMNFQKGSNP